MRLDLYELETAEVADAGGTGDTADVSGEAEAVSPETTAGAEAVSPEAETASPQAPAIDWNDPAVQAQIGELTQQQVYGLLEQLAQPQPEQVDPSTLDPFDDNFAPKLLSAFQQMLDERLGPVSNFVEETKAEQINGTITNVLGTGAEQFKVPEGDRDFFAVIADGYANRVQGEGMPAVQQAIKLAGEQYNQIVKRERAAGAAELRASLGGGDGDQATPYEPGVRGAAVTNERPPRDELDLVRRMIAQENV